MAQAIGTIGIGSSLAGGMMSAFGASDKAKSESQMYGYNAHVARLNAQIDKQNADYASNVGEDKAYVEGLKGAQTLGAIKVSQGASGLDVNSGSNKDVQTSQGIINKINTDTIRSNAAKTAYDYQVKAGQEKDQAAVYDKAGANATRAGMINVASSLVSTAGSVSSKWLQGQSAGLWGSNGKNPVDVGTAIQTDMGE